MDPAFLSLGVFALLFVFLALGMPLGFAMLVPAFLGLLTLLDRKSTRLNSSHT